MGKERRAVTRSWLDCYAAHDPSALLTSTPTTLPTTSTPGTIHLWGKSTIRAELDRQFDVVSDYRSTILNIFSTDTVVFAEGIDTFKHAQSGKDVTAHWTSVQEITPEGKISSQRDYADSAELPRAARLGRLRRAVRHNCRSAPRVGTPDRAICRLWIKTRGTLQAGLTVGRRCEFSVGRPLIRTDTQPFVAIVAGMSPGIRRDDHDVTRSRLDLALPDGEYAASFDDDDC